MEMFKQIRTGTNSRYFEGIKMDLSLREIGKILEIPSSSLTIWLSSYKFARFRNSSCYHPRFEICTEFLDEFSAYLEMKKSNYKSGAAEKLERVNRWRKKLKM
jgi:hypothetical protein